MKKTLILFFYLFSVNAFAIEKTTTFNKDIFQKAQTDGKIVVVNSWIKYCGSCAKQMKVLEKAESDFDNVVYLTFEVTNKQIADLLKVQYQTTLLIFKDNKEVYRSIGETTKKEIYKAIKSSI
tara:strand:- start:298 stop:666 length:369 start_codon:yes stop_codon:yes gene_type:complete